ncbi:MAG TPA: DUF3332 family protein [Polyangia bacterium]|jgi:hypothetical protein|nr:DUF3332 family protein [Polyangia bacterium]
MKRGLRDTILLAAVGLALTSSIGCYGHFKLVNAVRDFNEGVGPNRVMRSLVMWGLVIIPVYEFAWLGDVLVFNAIEFFNADPTAASATAEKRQTLPDGTEVRIARVGADTVRIRHTDAAGLDQAVDIVRIGDRAGYVRRPGGAIVGTVEQLPDGRLMETSAGW